jgi:hypothetical protein
MAEPVQSFRDFEHAGWADQAVCAHYDAQLSRITRQSVQALLDAAGVHQGTRVLDVATGTWCVAAPEQVFDATVQGTVRAAATLRGQSPAAREAIKAAVCQVIRGFRRGDQYEVPMPAVLAVAIKSVP